ncbi:hypothetical protein METBIDRAFT_11904 [Metschnikowia bicuspidata var. bicuspidata NRRL YB-4993]|uniref:Ribosomal protein L1 n=1 Tax=Metschnikowia bicuspidata var. bicuspidata NRRL YB-4993 TaxID=869754 RepID=A0A1A0HB74_9ASCO|nr:hypothetical protein METBIDRAFT_11904 [Metschnikowia bicuspidata var. bicuspidata NRRL YB-4993]OBA21379.1 hypothetical protein METBIDRAFT_11904 [Metschnikowia bicuspidata var. bicuspidata NRRL YB-4993]
MPFLLGDEARENAKRSIKALRAHTKKEHEELLLRTGEIPGQTGNVAPEFQPVHLVLNTKIHLVKVKDYTPRIIPISHKLSQLGEKSIALISRDGSFRQPLTEKGSPTEDLFNNIIPFSKAKQMGNNAKSLLRLFKENDVIVGDARIHKHLPDILKAQFYAKNKKVPFKILMSLPVPGKKTHGRIDQLCEPKYVRAQLKSIVGNTYFIPPAGGTCVSIVVGFTNWKVSEILTNIDDVISYLVEEKHRPVGGLLRSVDNLHSVLIRTKYSVALPVMNKKEADGEDESWSDS